ncbi:hypothetical protein NQ317_012534 [Molorchus minor]|uniref:Copper transport protein ATOX1 n=1 Tax=Molorchus minor TaxID=1323400 RepID=A0ABQ9K1G9_9CUCU|nr:hypothetical protein NQ317_012534 [Molorchus minor]
MADFKVHEFKVGMTCEGCSGAVNKVLGKMKDKGIEDIDISLEEQKVKVRTSLPAEDILEAIKKTGKPVELISSN